MYCFYATVVVALCLFQPFSTENITTWEEYKQPIEPLQGFYYYRTFDHPIIQSIYSDEIDAITDQDLTICDSKIRNARTQVDNGTRFVVDMEFKLKVELSLKICEPLNLLVVAHKQRWGPLNIERHRYYEGKHVKFI